jgi:sigma-B regulation protein RsbU (phosphoserine phosphatase)
MSARRPRVALFIRGGSYAYQDEVVIGAHQECSARGVDLICLSGGNVTLADPRNFLYTLPGHGDLDAAIVVKGTMGGDDGDPKVAALVEQLRPLPTCMIGSREPGVASVLIDNSSGVRALTRHLIEKHDCRRIAFVTGHGREAEQRLAGYRAAHKDLGVRPDDRLTIRGDFRFSAGQEAVAQLYDNGAAGCDAIVAANDWMALGALEALRARGLRVPEDVAVVGFDDVDEARFTTPPLTTVRQAPRRLGIEAVRLVLALAGGESRGDTMLETVPQIRQSCGCFRGTRRGEPALPVASPDGPPAADHASWVRVTACLLYTTPSPRDRG